MKTKLLLLLVTLALSACNYNVTSTQNKNDIVPPVGEAVPQPGALSGGILQSWRESLPNSFQNLPEGQSDFKVVANNSGDAVITWMYQDSSYKNYLYFSHLHNSVWSHPVFGQPLNVNPAMESRIQKIMITDAGGVKFFFSEEGNLYLKEFKNGVWGNSSLLKSIPSSYISSKFALSADGKIIVVIVDNSAHISTLYFAGSTWTDLGELLFQDGNSINSHGADYIDLAITSAGKALISFSHQSSSYTNATYIAEFNGSTWTVPSNENDSLGSGILSSVAMNEAGHSIVLWQSVGEIFIQENSGIGWGPLIRYSYPDYAKVTLFQKSNNEFIVLASGVEEMFFLSKSGTTLSSSTLSLPNLVQYNLKRIDNDNFLIVLSGEKTISYLKCTFANCGPQNIVSQLETNSYGNSKYKYHPQIETTSDRIILFWYETSSDNNDNHTNDYRGSEETIQTPLYLMPIIHYNITSTPS